MANSNPDELSFLDIPDPATILARPAPPLPAALAAPSPTRSDRRRRAVVSVVAGLLWVSAAFTQYSVRPDLTERGVLLRLALWGSAGAFVWSQLLRRDGRGMLLSSRVVQFGLAMVPVAYVVTALMIDGSTANVPVGPFPQFLCTGIASAMSVGPIVAASIFFRRSFLSAPVARGALIGAVCGLVGASAIYVHCPVEATFHVVVAHGLPILFGAPVGAALGAIGGRI
jgi:Negative regulator of sigma F